MKTVHLRLQLPDGLADQLDKLVTLAANYQTLNMAELQEYNFLSAEVLAPERIDGYLHEDDQVICWLPVDGTCPPTDWKQYLFTDGKITQSNVYLKRFMGENGLFLNRFTHYAELPVLGGDSVLVKQ